MDRTSMYRKLSIACCLLFAAQGLAQPNWARRLGAWSNDAYNAMVVDAAGSSYVTGEFGGVIDAGGTLLLSQGSLDIVVAKYDAAGELLWVRTFGGPGLDRGVALALGPSGELVVTGQFMGTMEVGGDVLVSQGGTQDMFVLSMQAADGAVNWVRQGGGADGVDQPNGISVGPDGAIAITGEFRGTAVFDGGTLTSITDPQTLLPSVDIFVAAYDAAGNALWLKHGAARYADRGMAVAHDALGNVYVTGQFSDTLTFDVTHDNAMFSAVFIARFTSAGVEDWFRIFGGGTYNQVFGMQVVESDRLLLVGDMQGTAIFLDGAPDFVTAVEPRSSFLLEVGLDGEYLQAGTWGSDHVVNTRALSVRDDEVIVLGRFQCQFTGFSALHGEGTWMATGPHDLYVARFQLSDLTLKDAQQFGGQKNKVPGGIAHATDGAPLFCGSFDRLLVFPSLPFQFSTSPVANAVFAPPVPDSFCGDLNYGTYVGLRGNGLMDAFIARGWAEGREPYDIFSRPAGDCDRPQRDAYIRMNGQGIVGPDSLRACHQATLFAYTNTGYVRDTAYRHTAPDMLFQWNTGSDSTHILVMQSGWYHVTVTSAAGCWERSDSLYVTIDPLPAIPLINDDVVVNTDAQQPTNLSACEPFAPWLWVTGVDPANSVTWYGPPGEVQGDSIQASITGDYTVIIVSPQGCMRQNDIRVTIIPSGPLPPLDAVYDVLFPQDTDLNDTVYICMNAPLVYAAHVQLMLDGQSVSLPYGVRMLRNCNGNGWVQSTQPDLIVPCSDYIESEGWYNYSIGIMLTNAPCGEDTLVFWNSGSIYVVPWEVTYPTASLSGPAFICPGDTATVHLACTDCAIINWSGPGIVQNFTDSIWVVGQGIFGVSITHVDTNGCTTSTNGYHQILWNPRPQLSVLPIDGIICPDSTALIFSDTQGTNYQWYGPLGPLNVDNDSIVTSQQGVYYLEMVDYLGCPVTSDPILVTDYATPYLNVLPDNTLCEPGETATLQVVTTGQSSLQWWTPLSGSALQQVVDQPGVYTCSVNACGITTVLSVEIFGNNAIAELVDPGPFVLCPGEEVLLQPQPGMALYYWLPGQVVGNQLLVGTSGTYTLVALDINGCEATTQTVVEVIPWTETMTTTDTLVCLGTPVLLSVPGSGELTWYADAALTVPLGVGNDYDLGVPPETVTLYVQQVEGSCSSTAQALTVTVVPYPQQPVIIAPDSVCLGAEVILTVDPEPGVTYTWSIPSGSYSGTVYTLSSAEADDAFVYSVIANAGICATPAAYHELAVLQPMPLMLSGDTMICPGGTATYFLPAGFTAPVWSDGSQGAQYQTTQAGPVTLNALDANGCAASASAEVQVFAFTVNATAMPVSICYGDNATLVVNGSGEFTWYADAALQSLVGNGSSLPVQQPTDSAVYYVVQSEWLCSAAPIAVPLNVTPVPVDVAIVGPEEVCQGTPLILTLVGGPGLGATWTTPTGTASGAEYYDPSADLEDAGTYVIVPFMGPCLGDTLSTFVHVLVPTVPDLGPDTTFCEGGEYYIELPSGFTDPLWSTGNTGFGIVVTTAGTYGVTVTDAQGCESYGQITLEQIHCDLELPNVITPNGDGRNDVWRLEPGQFLSASMRIFNRYGAVVWEGDPSRIGFRGDHYLNAEPLSEGAYFYVLLLERSNGRQQEQRGYLHIVR